MKITRSNFLGIRNPKWWYQEAPGVLQLCYPWAKGFAQVDRIFKYGYDISVLILKEDYIWQVLEEKRSIKLAKYIHDRFKKNPSFIWKILEDWKKRKKKFFRMISRLKKIDISKVSPSRLWKIYDYFYTTYINTYVLALVIESFEPYTQKRLKGLSLSKREIQQLSILEQPIKRTFLIRERIDFLKLALKIFSRPQQYLFFKSYPGIKKLKDQFPSLYQEIYKHSQDYHWLKNNYKDTVYLSPSYFANLLAQEIKQRKKSDLVKELRKLQTAPSRIRRKRQKILKEISLSKDLISLYESAPTLSWWHDDRKRIALIGCHWINYLLKTMTKRVNLSLTEIQYTFPWEIKQALQGKPLNKGELKKRRKFSVWTGVNDKEYFWTKDKAQKAWNVIFGKRKYKKAISGIPASPGRVQGKAKIVLDPKKQKFKKGEILVTSMTRPEFVPLMKRAKGVITDEGGITSHAAIISRELGIPCIVGTKIATKVLRNGEKIILRAHRGIAERI